MGSGTGSGYGSDTSSDGEFSVDAFRLVRRCPSPSKKRPRTSTTTSADQEGSATEDAVYAPSPAMAALSPEPLPSSPLPVPVSGDSQMSQPRAAGADQEEDDAPAPMAIDWSAESAGAGWEQQPGSWALTRPPQTVESIFDNFKMRRGAIIRALTTDEEAFFEKCDPGMQPLHLYGGTDGSWVVKPPELKLPAAEPEPTCGINIVRDTMERHKWLEVVAVHCDAWLIGISHFAASVSYMTTSERGRLFHMILSLPTVVQEILQARSASSRVEEKRSSGPEANNAVVEEEKEERSSGPNEANEVVEEEQGVYPIEEQRSSGPTEANKGTVEAEEDATNDDNNFCASCYSRYNRKAFWIRCDLCEKWYHGKCVNITSSEAEHMEHYECSDCYCDRVGHDCD